MNDKIVITSGKKYLDIDGYAAMFAYKHLLNSLGFNAYAMTTAQILNKSISNVILELGFKLDDIEVDNKTKFIVLDVSNPEFIDTIAQEKNIIEIIDHHIGYEEYWQKNCPKSQIEFIGSVCTIIYERYANNNKEDELSPSICKLLCAGILDNTLNLKSSNTTSRDIKAYNKLLEIGNLAEDWHEIYFKSCYKDIENTLIQSIQDDLKIEVTNKMLPNVFGQLIVLDKEDIIKNYNKVQEAFKGYEAWIFNVISLKDGKSYIFFKGENVKEKLEKLFNKESKDNYMELNRYKLRKEIIKIAKEFEE